jgi:hypothetical protein
VGGAWRAAGAEPAAAVPVPPGWKQSQEIRVGRTGLVRVAVPVESLGAARAQLEDLRLLDEAGREVPYLVERPAMPRPRMLPAKRFISTVLTDNTRLEIETGLTQAVAAVRLHSPASGFLKAVRVEGSSDGAAWRVLAEGRAIFRQRDGAEELSIALPSGAWPRLRLTVDDRRAAPVPFTAAELRVEAGPRRRRSRWTWSWWGGRRRRARRGCSCGWRRPMSSLPG